MITNKYYATKISDSVRGLCVPDKGLGGYVMVNLGIAGQFGVSCRVHKKVHAINMSYKGHPLSDI